MRSFRLKTVVFTTALSGAILAIFGWFGWQWLQQRTLDTLDSRILIPGQRIVEYHGWATDWQRFNESIVAAFGEDWQEDRILLVRSNMYNRDTLFHSENWPQALEIQDVPITDDVMKRVRMVQDANDKGFIRYELIARPHFYTVRVAGKSWRMVTLTNPEISFYIGINLDRYQHEILELRVFYFSTLSIVLLLLALGAYWIASRAMQPIHAIASTAQTITSRDLDQRIPAGQLYDQEFDVLIHTINEMLERLDVSFHQAMRFSADASHELKTPLTNIQNELTSRLQHCVPDSDEHLTLNEILKELERLKRIMRSLFLFSQADAGKMPLSKSNFNLSEQIKCIVRDAEILAEEAYSIHLSHEIEPNLCVYGDTVMLGQVIQNLINNAINHNLPGGWIHLTLRSHGQDGCIFQTENSAEPIPEQDFEKIFQRFQRGSHRNKNHTPGLGLGLSLANEIVRAHEGELRLVKSDATSTLFEVFLKHEPCRDNSADHESSQH